MVFGDKSNDSTIQIETTRIAESREEKLGITLDKKLAFKTHFESLCKKANQKLHALSRIANHFSTEQPKSESIHSVAIQLLPSCMYVL